MVKTSAIVALALCVAGGAAAQTNGFEGCATGPLVTGPMCPWTTTGGTVTVQPAMLPSPTCGFPTEGMQWCVVNSATAVGGFAVAGGGPAPFPIGAGASGNISWPVTIPTAPAGCDVIVRFNWTYTSPECPNDPAFNDWMSIDLVDPATGMSVQNLVYRDTFSATMVPDPGTGLTPDETGVVPTGFCPMPGPREAETACLPKNGVFVVSPALHGMSVNFEVHVGDGGDAAFNSYVHIDRVAFIVAGPGTPWLSLSQAPTVGGPLTIANAGLIPGALTVNVFSFTPCPTGPGTGAFFGLCGTPGVTIIPFPPPPAPAPPFVFLAAGCSVAQPPLAVPPGIIVEGLCAQVGPSVPSPGVVLSEVVSFGTQ